MTNRQKFKKVFYSRFGVLTLLCLLPVFYILSLFEFPAKGGQQNKDNLLHGVVYFFIIDIFVRFFSSGVGTSLTMKTE